MGQDAPVFGVVFTGLLLTAGMSAQLETPRIVAGSAFDVVITTDDPVGAIRAATVEVQVGTSTQAKWTALLAEQSPVGWIARVPASLVPEAGEVVRIRAELLGKRHGLLLELGYDAPLEVEVSSPARAKLEAEELRAAVERDEAVNLVGYVGLEARAGSSARIRATLGVGVHLSARTELHFGVTVGPKFSPPRDLVDGGPLVLGIETAFRGYALSVHEPLAPFVEATLGTDLRLPGLDPSAGARAGLSWRLTQVLSLDVSLGGALVVMNAAGTSQDPKLGAQGGIRVTLRFDGRARI